MLLEERKHRFDEICTAVSLMDLDNEDSLVLPNRLKGFSDINLRDALLCQAGRIGDTDEWSNKLAMSIIQTASLYEGDAEEAQKNAGDDIINALCITALLCVVADQKVEAIKCLMNIIMANEVFECGIPRMAVMVIGSLLSGMPSELLAEGLKGNAELTPYSILEREYNDDQANDNDN
jgi:hypothetical protein